MLPKQALYKKIHPMEAAVYRSNREVMYWRKKEQEVTPRVGKSGGGSGGGGGGVIASSRLLRNMFSLGGGDKGPCRQCP